MVKHAHPSQRQLKAGELIRRTLADILRREHFRDPALQNASITISEVRPSPDLKHAIVYAAPLTGRADTASEAEAVLVALNRSAKFIRGHLGRELKMKSTPALKFMMDTSFDQASDLQELLDRPDVKRDLD